MTMRVLIVLAAAVAAATGAGAAMAQSGYGARKPAPSWGVPQTPPDDVISSSGRRSGSGAQPSAGGGFKPYEGFKGGSVHSSPRPAASPGARPCTTSVYVNACDKRRGPGAGPDRGGAGAGRRTARAPLRGPGGVRAGGGQAA